MDFYKLKKNDILDYFKVDENCGLRKNDLKYKKEKYGLNRIEIKKDISFWEIYITQVKSFLNLLLLFLVIFAFFVWYYTGKLEHLVDSIIIFIIFLFNTIIGTYQNYSAKKIANTLNKMLENEALVLRDHKKIKINSYELFPGDIIYLNGGDKIPADCYLLESNDLKVDESLLTGESVAILKNSKFSNNNNNNNSISYNSKNKSQPISISNMNNIVFMNSYVISGDAKAIVIRTGKNTEIGKIATSVQERVYKNSFINEIDEVSKKISYFAIILILIVIGILYIKGLDLISIFLVGSALIIGSIPEGLPAIVIFLLSRSIHRLAKEEILVKDMGLLETLGSIDVLCTDKTGTLTENKMTLKRLFLFGKEIKDIKDIKEINSFKKTKNYSDILFKIILYVNNIKIVNGESKGDPEDLALINYVRNFDEYSNKEINKNNILKFEPFNSENKYSYCELKYEKIRLKKGAVEVLLNSSKYIILDGKKKLLTNEIKKKIEKNMASFTNDALRLIGFSYSDLDGNNEVFLGFSGLYDAPKKGINETINSLYNAKIEIKMITGDSKETAIAIAKESGFKNIKAMNYDEIINLDENEFKKVIEECNVFSRMTPELKFKILKGLQENNHRVAITGDGVNDSIALKHGDVGVVMGSGSDIAKESGDIILINNDFRTLPKAIHEGRGIFHNIRKVVNYLLTANLAEVLTIFISSFFGLIPFTAIQILWVNFVTDVAPSMALGLDEYPKDILKKKPNGKNEKILNRKILLLTLFISIKKVALIFILFLLAYKYSPYENRLIFAQTISFTWLVLTHFIRIAAIRFDEKVNFFSNKYVNYSLFGVLFIQLTLVYTPLGNFFSVVPITIYWVLLLIIFILIGIILAKIISKLVDYLDGNFKNI